MDLLFAFIIFLISMVGALIFDVSMIIALLIGLIAFSIVTIKRGWSFKDLAKMCFNGAKDSIVVTEVMAVIGFVTAIWRASGTITIFVYYGMKIITPSLFILIAFLLCVVLSYALGTSFGVAGTVGVIFMALARSGGVDPVITAGALMSGIYFGDRCSPVSSSAQLVCGCTDTEIYSNVKAMLKTCVIPFVASTLIYLIISLKNPITGVDESLVSAFESEFNLTPWAFVPAVFILVLPLLKVSIFWTMGLSILTGAAVAYFMQGLGALEIIKIMILGYESNRELGSILNGGGLISMVEIIVILVISSMYSGIFNETGMLDSLQDRLTKISNRIGRYLVTLILSIATPMVFCNQTISTLIVANLMKKTYDESGAPREELAIDMENSVILTACTVPWTIGCSVPLSFFGIGSKAMIYAFYMYLLPILYLFTKRLYYSTAS